MPDTSRTIEQLSKRKRLLKAESELNRQAIRLECSELARSVESLNAIGTSSSVALWKTGMVVLPLIGLSLVRRGRAWRRLAQAALIGWQVFKVAKSLMRTTAPANGAAPLRK